MTDELKTCPVNGKHMSAAHEKACLVCSPRPTPPADAVPTGAGGNSNAFICCEGVGKHAKGCPTPPADAAIDDAMKVEAKSGNT